MDALDVIGGLSDSPSPKASALPLAHFVPRRSALKWMGTECDQLVAGTYPGAGEQRVCFDLGPSRNRRTGHPVVMFLVAPRAEQSNWWAYPCDAGGVACNKRGARNTLVMHAGTPHARRWRLYIDELVRRAHAGFWERYVRAVPPSLDGIPEPLRSVLGKPDDSAGWTPEVCAAGDVKVEADAILAAAVLSSSLLNCVDSPEWEEKIDETLRKLKTSLGGLVVELTPSPDNIGPPNRVGATWSQEGVLKALGLGGVA